MTEDKDPYRDWPYAEAYLLQTLDPDLIEGHARQILSRALNIGRVVAFVGAGVAMSYGRISWRELVDTEYRRVRAHLNEFIMYFQTKIIPGITVPPEVVLAQPRFNHIRRLEGVLTALNLEDGREVRSERYPMIFQLCEQLDNALFSIDWKPTKRPPSLRQHAMNLTIDDRGHADQILIDALLDKDADEPFASDPRDVIAKAEHGLSDVTVHRLFFRRDHAEHLFNLTSGDVRCEKLRSALWQLITRDQTRRDQYLLPTERYLIGALLRLFPQKGPIHRTRSRNDWWTAIEWRVVEWLDGHEGQDKGATAQIAKIAKESRHRLVPQYRDPLLQLQERLEISRYLTTNYDFEIERLFEDQGYRTEPASKDDSASTFLTPTVRKVVFENKNAGDLVAFAARDRSRNGTLVHLHGRADEGGNIIVTESDYQRRYLRTDDSRDMVDNAIALTFGANPVLFVGSNMGEDDILRPLRQFMSNPSRVGDRIAVALVPALDERNKRTEEKISHLGKYGVYTIHFGQAGVNIPKLDALSQDNDAHQVEWLPWIWQIKRDVERALRCFTSLKADKLPAQLATYAELDAAKKLLKVGPELIQQPNTNFARKNTSAIRKKFMRNGLIVAPETIEGIKTDPRRALDLGAEVAILNASIEWLRSVSKLTVNRKPEVAALRREARAHAVALQGAGDAILAVFTCARLIRARWDWDEWKNTWYSIPAARSASEGGIDRPALERQAPGAPRLLAHDAESAHRNGISLLPKPERSPRRGRFYAGAPSQTFFGLIGALNGSEAESFRIADGRRILLLSGRRGLGKGHFFSALDDRPAQDLFGPRLREFLIALSPKQPGPSSPQWVGLAFYNLSFAHEVMSAFDHLTEFMWKRFPIRSQTITARYESLKHDRIERLRMMLTEWNAIPVKSLHRRLLVSFNSVGILFDGEGRAKNGQVKRIFDLLFSDEYSSAPIDLVLVCQDEYIPRAFRRDHVPKSWNIALLERQNLDAKSVAANKRRWETLDLGDGPNRPASEITSVEDVVWQRPEEPAVPEPWHALRVGKIRTAPPNSEYRTASVAIHILHEARATIITASYFPRIGLLLARHQLREDTEFWNWIELSRSKTRQFPQIFEEDATDFRNAMREALNEVRPEGPIPPKKLIPVITVQLAVMLELGLIDGATGALEKKFRELLRKFNSIEETSVGSAGPNEGVASCAFSAILDALDEIPGATPWPRDSDWSREQTARLHRVIGAYDHRMRDLHNAVAGGRYLLTLLLSAAYETTTALSAPRFPPRKFIPIEEMDAVTYSVDRFLDRAVLSLIGVPTKRRSDVVIQQFLAVIHRHHERNEEMPIQVKLKWERPQFVDNRTASPAIYRLLMELVWHLSIIGQAVEADVLAWCPRVREACDGLTDGSIALTDRQYLDCVDEALALGVNRCLIFELRPEVTSSLPERRRYAVHGLVQRDVFRKLGTPDAEFTDTDQFTLSLYASQPDDLPRLSRDAHNQIATTIAALAGYPDMQAGGKGKIGARGARAELHKDLPPDYRKRLLRAAFGVMRSIYSVAVLARFDHDPDGEEGTPGHEGYFEEYRRVVRWILGAALDIGTMGQGSEKGTYAPFYAEEIVWLYNECAVLSLVQGRLNDAQALFEAALLAAKRIEPDESGALHIRILLNKAVVDIERGYGLAARAYLERIAHLVNEHPVPPLLAKGYLGLIDHLAGEVEAAIVEYREAITGLMKLRRSRSASIFSRHLGDLLGNNLGEARSEEAKQEIHNAIHFAQEGGHEDIRHMALLSLARWRLRGTQNIDTAEFHRELDTVERYAKVVGMPRLLCEVGLVRARLLLLQGEARLAGTIATQSLQIATVNDLRIRKIGSLLLLAEIYLKRGDKHAVRPILQLGARMAKLYNHFFALTYAQNFASLVDPELG